MSKIIGILLLLLFLGGCRSTESINKEEIQEKSENIDLVIDDLDDLIEESEEIEK